MFVAIEGIMGSGKTTLIKGLKKASLPLPQQNIKYRCDRGETPFGNAIWKTLCLGMEATVRGADNQSELLSMNIVYRDELLHSVLPAMKRKDAMVIRERSFPALYANCYALYLSDLLDVSWWDEMFMLHDMFCWSVFPTLTIWIDIPADVSIERTHQRDYSNIPKTEYWVDRFEKFRKGYEDYGKFVKGFSNQKSLPGTNTIADMGAFCRIDGTLPSDRILETAIKLISEHYHES